MDNIYVSLLDKSDVIDEKKLECLDNYGLSAGFTDVFLLTGGKSNISKMNRIYDEFGLKNRTAPYFCNTYVDDKSVCCVDEGGNVSSISEKDNTCGLRPTVEAFGNYFDDYIISGLDEVEIGEYPQYAAAHMVGLALEDEYSNHLDDNGYNGGVLLPTGKNYTFVQNGVLVSYPEYYYGTSKFIRMINNNDENVILSSANTIKPGDAVWVKVTPVKWLVDYKNERFISKFVLLSGIKPEFDLFNYLDKYMKEDILVDQLTIDTIINMILSSDENVLPIEDIRQLSFEEIKSLLDEISKKDYGYSRTLKEFYF